ncbi:DNA-binding transcriptional regulator, GntR family [Microbacterium azadirachtae]|nr:DNA-binding transcriptional regulator, GntR family [Microbacterium azadirachtae]SEG56252.1 DNA-binding transcriptional regulator, GntR family [Microbacterium azadirachtae]SEG59053.1 DNA-binding transcriptional regulator, GntR family [Microbacterium azadirachtae]
MLFWGNYLGVVMDERGPQSGVGRALLGAPKQLLADEVYQRVGASIIDGTLPPGHRIRDAELAEKFGVSRMPIREALQRLERVGLVEMHPSRYTQVTEVPPQLTEKTLEYAGYFGGAVAAIAVPRLTETEREQAAALARALDEGLDDPTVLAARRSELLQYLSRHSDNEILDAVLDQTSMPLSRNLRPWTVEGAEREQMREIHASLAEAILAGDGHAAEHFLRAMHHVA